MPVKAEQFAQISQKVTETWRAMTERDLEVYGRLTAERKKELENGRNPKPEEKALSRYLRAVREFLL